MKIERRIPDEFTDLLGAALLLWLDTLDGQRAPRSRVARLEAAVHAAEMLAPDWPTPARDLFDVSVRQLSGEFGQKLDKTVIVDATEAVWPSAGEPHFAWQDRRDIGDAA